MKPITLLSSALALALASSPALAFQDPDLAALAKQEKKRRKAVKGTTKTVTTDDLKGGGSAAPAEPEASASPGTAASSSAKGAPAAKSEEEERAEKQQKWRDELQKANQDVARLTDQVAKLQSSLNDVSQNVYSATRANRLAGLEQAQRDLAAAQQKASGLEDEGRRNGYR